MERKMAKLFEVSQIGRVGVKQCRTPTAAMPPTATFGQFGFTAQR
jgi:hypothetical protein